MGKKRTCGSIALRDKLRGLRILIVDEVGMITLNHFHLMNGQAQTARDNTLFFGNVLVVLAGDFNQHAPPGGKALYKDTHDYVNRNFHHVEPGSNEWRQIDNAFLFKTIHRFTADESGQKLLAMSQVFVDLPMTSDR